MFKQISTGKYQNLISNNLNRTFIKINLIFDMFTNILRSKEMYTSIHLLYKVESKMP